MEDSHTSEVNDTLKELEIIAEQLTINQMILQHVVQTWRDKRMGNSSVV